MSFVITLYVREGIVMASDSRLTLNTQQQSGTQQIVNLAVGQSDTNYKTFLTPTNVAINTYGAADIGGVPIAGYIESFINEIVAPQSLTVDSVADEILTYFRAMQPTPATMFHVAGYNDTDGTAEQVIWQVDIAGNNKNRLNPVGQQGASWGGESDILTRLVQPLAQVDNAGQVVRQLPYHQIPWGFFTLQDAIDFAIFAVRSTIDAIRFEPRPKTVGGPIDVLVVKPTEAFWVQRKELGVKV